MTEELLLLMQPYVVKTARYLAGPEAWEDLAQETLLRLWKGTPQGPIESPKAYAAWATKNCFLESRRSHKSRQHIQMDEVTVKNTAAPAACPDSSILLQELISHVKHPAQRSALDAYLMGINLHRVRVCKGVKTMREAAGC